MPQALRTLHSVDASDLSASPDFDPPTEHDSPEAYSSDGVRHETFHAPHETPDAPRESFDATSAHTFGPIRPDRLTVWPAGEGRFGIDVRWEGRECILRAVVVRRMLADAGYEASAGNSIDGRTWELNVRPVPADEVANVISNFIW